MQTNSLQFIYDLYLKRNTKFLNWAEAYKDCVEKYIETARNKKWDEKLLRESLLQSTQGCISTHKQSFFSNDEKKQIIKNWNEIVDLLAKIVQVNDIDEKTYNYLHQWFKKFTKKTLKSATNRIIVSLLPAKLTTILKDDILKFAVKKLSSFYPKELEYSENDSWLQLNKKLIDFLNKKIKFEDPYHVSLMPYHFTNDSYSEGLYKFLPYFSKMDLLLNHQNLILHGAPGTGKTYLAKELAKILTKGDQGRIAFIQFHPSYDYTDFIEGLKPSEDKDKMFELKNGIFREFCNKAKDDPDNKYVFIIDEINRGDISKIFGEVFYSIEPGYRGEKGAIETQYSYLRNENDKKFYVPENVYIIGTMNDIDRSVETFDFAIRRRFVWYEVKVMDGDNFTPEAEAILEKIDEKYREEAKTRLKTLNKAIEEIGLDRTYHIGPAYFLNLEKYYNPQDDNTEEAIKKAFNQLWQYHLEPLLHEYVRTLDDPEGKLKKLEEAYKPNE